MGTPMADEITMRNKKPGLIEDMLARGRARNEEAQREAQKPFKEVFVKLSAIPTAVQKVRYTTDVYSEGELFVCTMPQGQYKQHAIVQDTKTKRFYAMVSKII